MRSEWGGWRRKWSKESSRILREAAGASFGCRPGCYPFRGGATRQALRSTVFRPLTNNDWTVA